MNIHKLSFIFALSAFLFISCEKEDDVPQEASDPDAIKLSATIGALQTRVLYDNNGDTKFDQGDEIRVINHTRSGKNKSDAVYQLGGGEWKPATDNDYVVWDGIEANTFYGVYPATADYATFPIPTDQSGGVEDADWMTASYIGSKSAGNVAFQFQHLLSKVTVTITEWNDEFGGKAQTISSPQIRSTCRSVELSYGTGENGTNKYMFKGDSPFIDPEINRNSYTAIVAPGSYAPDETFMSFSIGGRDFNVLVKDNEVLTNGLQPGKHYTFSLAVGKDTAAFSGVTVQEWANGDAINGGVAKECLHEEVDKGICKKCGTQAYVNLGLSVNWATVNIGASKLEQVGDFFAWGETEPKETFSQENYKLGDKYNATDGKTELDDSDDAAKRIWGNGWRMPTAEEFAELLDESKCTWTWTTVNGRTGYLITSKVPGYEGNSIFLPFELYKTSGNETVQRSGYWSKSLLTEATTFAKCISFHSSYKGGEEHTRFKGMLIRPVREK